MIQLNLRIVIHIALIGCIVLLALPGSTVKANLCQTITVSSAYPHQASPGQQIPFVTTVSGSCTSDGEDYFAVRVDLADSSSKAILSSNSTSIGYNANNFSVNVQNVATTPMSNGTWPVDVDTYMIQAGAASGKNLLNATTIAIQVGDPPLPEFQQSQASILILSVIAIPLTLWQRTPRKKNRKA